MNDLPGAAEGRDLRSRQARIFNERWQHPTTSNAYESKLLRETIVYARAALEKYIPRSTPLTLVDVGCGDGALLAGVADLTTELLGLDLSATGLARARDRGIPHASFALGSIEDFRSEQKYDAACLFEVLEHVGDPARTLRGIAEVVRPGGVFIMSTPNDGRLSNRLRRIAGRPITLIPSHVREYSWSEQRKLLEAVGFKFLERQGGMLYGGQRLLPRATWQELNWKLGLTLPDLAVRAFSVWRH